MARFNLALVLEKTGRPGGGRGPVRPVPEERAPEIWEYIPRAEENRMRLRKNAQ